MRTTIDIDDRVWQAAVKAAPPGSTKRSVIETALHVYVQRQAMAVLADLGGTLPDYEPGPRRRD